eukprot:jgi/Ulvmu1/6746/UM030_0081.1
MAPLAALLLLACTAATARPLAQTQHSADVEHSVAGSAADEWTWGVQLAPHHSRALLHGCHRGTCMPPCPRCAFPKLSGGVGHCRSRRVIRPCTRRNVNARTQQRPLSAGRAEERGTHGAAAEDETVKAKGGVSAPDQGAEGHEGAEGDDVMMSADYDDFTVLPLSDVDYDVEYEYDPEMPFAIVDGIVRGHEGDASDGGGNRGGEEGERGEEEGEGHEEAAGSVAAAVATSEAVGEDAVGDDDDDAGHAVWMMEAAAGDEADDQGGGGYGSGDGIAEDGWDL